MREEQGEALRAGQPAFLSWSLERTPLKPRGNASGIRAAAQFVRPGGDLKQPPVVEGVRQLADMRPKPGTPVPSQDASGFWMSAILGCRNSKFGNCVLDFSASV